ncbi:MAG: sigma-54-dependent Fis family transcriptional regulator [Bacteroidales bacterium]|nr:sigma-54-dependent Fis family transcriptional regulator [Candidatus Physcousia equi]
MKKNDLDTIKKRYQIVGDNEQLERSIDTALQVAPTDLSVLIQGESGVGKEVIPRIIHDNSPRRTKRYIPINCGSIPEGTIDSELFGHEKGSFTGALGEHDGYFAAANGGTLFLDEIGELPMSTQARLLRVLETGEYMRVGSSEPRKTNVRIVAATNVNLQKAIRDGKFREDLYFRLCTISIKIPPLRERGKDIVRIFKNFALETANKYDIPTPLSLTPDAEKVMMQYKWPGNVRQLRHLAEQMSILCKESRIVTPEVLREYDIVPGGDTTEIASIKGSESIQFDYAKERAIIFAMLNQLANDVKALKEGGVAQTQPSQFLPAPSNSETKNYGPSFAQDYEDDLDDAELVEDDANLNLENMEKKLIEEALRRNRNRRKNAAIELGISERTLYRKIKDYGIEE